jgi:D-alanyl-D-alanine carboxypeptidase (penicillin-binding protein 5/6)
VTSAGGAPLRAAAAALIVAAALPAAAAEGTPRGGPADRFPRAGASYLVLRDGAVLWARHAHTPLPPASLTKLMTALVAVEQGWAPDAWIRVSARAARATGARIGLRQGEQIRTADALAATLVASGNDACLALAEHVAGTAEAFVARMNQRAAELGLAGTRFENPCGHDDAHHRSTARDLAALTRSVLAVPLLREVVARERVVLTTRSGRRIEAATRNSLLGRVRGLTGVKTGTTQAAGRCVIARAERGGTEVLVVLLDAPDRWWTAAALVEAAFEEPHRD